MNKVNKYLNQHFPSVKPNNGRLETDYGYKIRQKWFELDCPPYTQVDKELGLPHNTTNQYASKYDYPSIKKKADELQNELDKELLEKYQSEVTNEFKEIWNKEINDAKHELNILTIEINRIENKINSSNTEKERENLLNKWIALFRRKDEINLKMSRTQDKVRINAKLSNSYKDPQEQKFKVENNSKIEITQNKSIKELEEEYEDYFKELKQNLESDTQGNNNKDNSQ